MIVKAKRSRSAASRNSPRVLLYVTLLVATFVWTQTLPSTLLSLQDGRKASSEIVLLQNAFQRQKEFLLQRRDRPSAPNQRQPERQAITLSRSDSCPLDSIPVAFRVETENHDSINARKQPSASLTCVDAPLSSQITILGSGADCVLDDDQAGTLACVGSVLACCPPATSGLNLDVSAPRGDDDTTTHYALSMDMTLLEARAKENGGSDALPKSCEFANGLLHCPSLERPVRLDLDFRNPRSQGCTPPSDEEDIMGYGSTEYTVTFPHDNKFRQAVMEIDYECIGNGRTGSVDARSPPLTLPDVQGSLSSDCVVVTHDNDMVVRCTFPSAATVEQQVTCPGGLGLAVRTNQNSSSSSTTTTGEEANVKIKVAGGVAEAFSGDDNDYLGMEEMCHNRGSEGTLDCYLQTKGGLVEVRPQCETSFFSELAKDI